MESRAVDSNCEGTAARLTPFLWVHLFSELCNMAEVQHLCNNKGRMKAHQYIQSSFHIRGLMVENKVLAN